MIGLIHLCILSQNKAYSLRYFESTLYLSTLNLNWITIRCVSHEHCSSCSKRNAHYFSHYICLQKLGLIFTVKIRDRDKWATMMKWVTVLQKSAWWKRNIILKVLFFKHVSCPACIKQYVYTKGLTDIYYASVLNQCMDESVHLYYLLI